MNIRKYMTLVVSGGITLLLSVVAIFFLLKFAGRYREVADSLQTKNTRLEALKKRNPFPSAQNVELAGKNLQDIEARFAGFTDQLSRGQYAPPVMEPAQFPLLYQKTLLELGATAASNGVAMPERFRFGFERYERELPAKDHLPRLARQLHWVEQVSRALFGAQIRSITAIERHVFEDEAVRGAAVPGVADAGIVRRVETPTEPGAGVTGAGYFSDPAGLYVRERMRFTFNARESAVWSILALLPRLPVFCVVSEIEIKNEAVKPARVNPQAPGTPGMVPEAGMPVSFLDGPMPMSVPMPLAPPQPMDVGAASGTNAPPARLRRREERVVAGQTETVNVRMSIDFYYFNRPGQPAPGGASATKEAKP